MDNYPKEAVELARAQASVCVMSEDEIAAFVQKVAASLRSIAENDSASGSMISGQFLVRIIHLFSGS